MKQEAEILVILGNPPYDGFAAMAVEEERNLSEAYRSTKEAPDPQGQGLNDLYVRFYRMAERRIAEGVPKADTGKPGPPRIDGKGIVCFISNYSWLDGDSHPGMRERIMEVFDSISIDCLNGDSRETGKRTPDGKPDPSVFSTEKNREGIQVGTAIAMLERWPQKADPPPEFDPEHYQPRAQARFRQWWGKDKRAELEASLSAPKAVWQALNPALKFGLKLVPLSVNVHYGEWPLVTDLFPWKSPGINSSRDADLTHADQDTLKSKIAAYFDPKRTWKQLAQITPSLCISTKEFNAEEVRKQLLSKGVESGRFLRFCYRPFEERWLYWHPETKLLDRNRVDLVRIAIDGNMFFASRPKAERTREGSPCAVTSLVGDRHLTRPGSMFFSLFFYDGASRPDNTHGELFATAKPVKRPNLSKFAKSYLNNIGLQIGDTYTTECDFLFFHTIAICHAPIYLSQNEDALMQGWPRIPLPKDAPKLRAGAALGRQITALLDPTAPVPGVTDIRVRPALKGLGELTINPSADNRTSGPDLKIEARWGYAGQGGVIMPGPGRVSDGTRGRDYLDIHLNGSTRWKDVPESVWNYTLGGYQVLKKWLSYREYALLKRPLTSEEAETFTHNVRRIAAILALSEELDSHYRSSL